MWAKIKFSGTPFDGTTPGAANNFWMRLESDHERLRNLTTGVAPSGALRALFLSALNDAALQGWQSHLGEMRRNDREVTFAAFEDWFGGQYPMPDKEEAARDVILHHPPQGDNEAVANYWAPITAAHNHLAHRHIGDLVHDLTTNLNAACKAIYAQRKAGRKANETETDINELRAYMVRNCPAPMDTSFAARVATPQGAAQGQGAPQGAPTGAPQRSYGGHRQLTFEEEMAEAERLSLYTCPDCGTRGDHFRSKCPKRRKTLTAYGNNGASGSGGSGSGGGGNAGGNASGPSTSNGAGPSTSNGGRGGYGGRGGGSGRGGYGAGGRGTFYRNPNN